MYSLLEPFALTHSKQIFLAFASRSVRSRSNHRESMPPQVSCSTVNQSLRAAWPSSAASVPSVESFSKTNI